VATDHSGGPPACREQAFPFDRADQRQRAFYCPRFKAGYFISKLKWFCNPIYPGPGCRQPSRAGFIYAEEITVLEAGFYNMDCMDALKEYPDGYFDLAIVDPPYGDGNAGGGV